jgi:hypothetical protein
VAGVWGTTVQLATAVFPVRSFCIKKYRGTLPEREGGIIIIIITGNQVYFSESSQALPARPLVKIGWRKSRAFESEDSKVGKWSDDSVQQGGEVEHWGGIFECNCGVD